MTLNSPNFRFNKPLSDGTRRICDPIGPQPIFFFETTLESCVLLRCMCGRLFHRIQSTWILHFRWPIPKWLRLKIIIDRFHFQFINRQSNQIIVQFEQEGSREMARFIDWLFGFIQTIGCTATICRNFIYGIPPRNYQKCFIRFKFGKISRKNGDDCVFVTLTVVIVVAVIVQYQFVRVLLIESVIYFFLCIAIHFWAFYFRLFGQREREKKTI